ncbi:MAG: Choline-sulfatase [SAR116 cluster bacterium MED-G04]|nr:MAG: Choline-sulfatase [SAR116 cluster bacterium MED-G04]
MTSKPRNTLILMSDEHRRDAMGCAGHPIVQTPNLDQIAASGTRFTRAWTASPMCVPTRAALACGTYVHQNGFWDSANAYDGSIPSWMHHLRDAGVETTSIGKLHFKSARIDNGFEQEILPMHIVGEKGWLIGLLRENPPQFDGASELAKGVGGGDSSYTRYDRAITDAAVDWLSDPARHDRPFAGFISMVSPHYPLIAPEEFYRLYDPAEMPLPCGSIPDHAEIRALSGFFDYHSHFDDDSMRKAIAAYYGLVSFLDHCIGRIMAALDEAGLKDDTLIIYTSDHGELLGEHGMWTKQVMYEASAGIPMMITGPGIPGGKVTSSGAHFLDVASTAMTAGGCPQPDHWPGVDLAELANAPEDRSRTIFSEYHDGGSSTGNFMVAWDGWKLIWYVGREPQLFNLDDDPGERHDLAPTVADDPIAASALKEGKRRLDAICDVEEVSARAFADQRRMIEENGGEEACLNAFVFNATPTPVEQAELEKNQGPPPK